MKPLILTALKGGWSIARFRQRARNERADESLNCLRNPKIVAKKVPKLKLTMNFTCPLRARLKQNGRRVAVVFCE